MIITDEMLREAAFEAGCAMLRSLPDESDCHHEFSKAYRRKMSRLLWRTDHRIAYKTLKHVAGFLVMLLATASLFLTFNVEARAALRNWVMDRIEGFYEYFFVGESEETELQAYYLDWIPEGYTIMTTFQNEKEESFFYSNDSGQIMRFTFIRGSDGYDRMLLGNGEYKQVDVRMDDFRAKIYLSLHENNANAIVWRSDSGDTLFYVSAFLSEDNLIKIAQNVKPEKIF